MTPADRIREVLAAHGVDPETCSLNGPRTLLGDALDDAMEEHAEAWRMRAWDTLRALERTLDRAEAAEARHLRHLARLRWRREHKGDKPLADIERLARRQRSHDWASSGYITATIRHLPIAGTFPGDLKRPAGVLP